MFTKKLDDEVEKVRENREWRVEYMAWISELEESKEEAREEGRKEGREEGLEESREESAVVMLRDNLSLDKVILYSGLSKARVLELQKSLVEN